MARCKVCGYRIRGANHEEGAHHQGAARQSQGRINSATYKRRQPWSNAPKGWKPPEPPDED